VLNAPLFSPAVFFINLTRYSSKIVEGQENKRNEGYIEAV